MKENIKYSHNLEITGASFFYDHVHINYEDQISLHQQESWELSYVITGRGTRVIGDLMESFSEGEVILIPPNIAHCWYFDASIHDTEGKIENISITFSNKLLENCRSIFVELTDTIRQIQENSNAISFSMETLSEIQQIMLSMSKETTAERIVSFIRLLNIIANPHTTNIVGHPTREDKKTKKIQSIYLYVMNNYQHNITLEKIAQFVGMEKSSFCVFFKKMTNKSFFTFLTEYRIDSSCQMLLETNKSISEVCIASGFRDVPYYNRIFKKIKHITPGEYRKRYRTK
ncbi:AraC family transcriptional regulator [Dysgonomonas sp. 25]|uniref:AraC family transcriptional regulator n=1 Tax=Dysgonomonas sp. 25 TaxID=2302933 RepID=UPI0013D51468|nr:AraC family transcriptional regulator [Dysgonomonas sp. 25]NDV68865.1 AraC family transcriptional regulator [Dysgonomonas sp. 25]